MRRAAAVVIVSALALAACGGDDDESVPTETRATANEDSTEEEAAEAELAEEEPTTTEVEETTTTESTTTTSTTTTSTTTTTIPEADVVGYFEAIFSGDLTDPAALVAEASPGSPAELYGKHQVYVRIADRDNGAPRPPTAVTRQDDNIEACSEDPLSGETFCSVYSDFTVEGGKLYTFTVDDIVIDDRLGTEGPPTGFAGTEATVLSSYRSASGDALYVTIRFVATDPIELSGLFGSTYLDPTGRQVQSLQSVGPTSTLRGGATTVGYVIFDQASPGGQLFIEASTPDFSTIGEFQLQVPAAVYE